MYMERPSLGLLGRDLRDLTLSVVLKALAANAVSIENAAHGVHYFVKYNDPIIMTITYMNVRQHLICFGPYFYLFNFVLKYVSLKED